MKKNSIVLSIVALSFLTGCGGGGDTTTSTTPTTAVATSTISGTVPGTLIEAFCEDGTYVQVTSTQNGTAQHPFTLTIPQNTNCKLVMTTNENNASTRVITPIGFVNGTATGTSITITGDVNLSHVPLALDPALVSDANGDKVVDTPLPVDLNGTGNANITNVAVFDADKNGHIDAYDDDDDDGTVNAYEDDDSDGVENIHDDDDSDHTPDYMDDDDNDGKMNHRDDDDNNDSPDYIEDDDNDGVLNHIDDDNHNDHPDYIEDDDNDGTPNYLDDDHDDYYDNNTSSKTFNADVMPILNSNCKSCHGPSGDFTITTGSETYENIMSLNYGTSPKDKAEYMRDKGDGDYGHGGGDKLNVTEYETLESWIYAGAMNN